MHAFSFYPKCAVKVTELRLEGWHSSAQNENLVTLHPTETRPVHRDTKLIGEKLILLNTYMFVNLLNLPMKIIQLKKKNAKRETRNA